MDLSNTPLEKLPTSLSRLHNLQVLILDNCSRLHALPKGINKLIDMRHLVAEKSLISSIEGIGNLTSLQQLKLFDASKHKIRELKGMNQLRELRIEHLEHVEGKEEACQVELIRKNWLKKLKLGWRGDIITENNRLDEEVLEGLQPNADLKEFIIRGYEGMSFPSWMMMGDQSLSFLESISLLKCGKVASLPPMGQLPFLKHLRISGMSGIKQVGHEFYGSSRVMKKVFPSMETLFIEDMSEWVVWKGAEEGQSFFPCLRKLVVTDCPKLMELPPLPPLMTVLRLENLGVTVLPGLQGTSSTTTSQALSSSLSWLAIVHCSNLKDSITSDGALPTLLPWLQNCASLETLDISSELLACLPVTAGGILPSLKSLEIIGDDTNIVNKISFDEGLYRCLQQLTSLTGLFIYDCQSLTSLPGEVLTSLYKLERLGIHYCQQLTSLELQPLTSLRELELEDCPKLMVTTSSSLSPLVRLEIFDSSQLLTGVLLHSFPSLKELLIKNCENLRSLPTELGSLSSLKVLVIHNCPHIRFLPTELGSLSSLKILVIYNCPQIQSLPDIERLPASLSQLEVLECPTLKERCQREGGPDWYKISHIPDIRIDEVLI